MGWVAGDEIIRDRAVAANRPTMSRTRNVEKNRRKEKMGQGQTEIWLDALKKSGERARTPVAPNKKKM